MNENHWPDYEGIATSIIFPSAILFDNENHWPDYEGIATRNQIRFQRSPYHENHWPDYEGIATRIKFERVLNSLHENHWPDYEGIATHQNRMTRLVPHLAWESLTRLRGDCDASLAFVSFTASRWESLTRLWGDCDLIRCYCPVTIYDENHWPDYEGIATQYSIPSILGSLHENHWPDYEGIATDNLKSPL